MLARCVGGHLMKWDSGDCSGWSSIKARALLLPLLLPQLLEPQSQMPRTEPECRGSHLHASRCKTAQWGAGLACDMQITAGKHACNTYARTPTHKPFIVYSIITHTAPSRTGTCGTGWLPPGWAPPAAGESSGTVPRPRGWLLPRRRTALACGRCHR